MSELQRVEPPDGSTDPSTPASRNKPKGGPRILVDTSEAAQRLSICVNTLAKIPLVDLPRIRIGPSKRGVRYLVSDLEAYAQRLRKAAMRET